MRLGIVETSKKQIEEKCAQQERGAFFLTWRETHHPPYIAPPGGSLVSDHWCRMRKVRKKGRQGQRTASTKHCESAQSVSPAAVKRAPERGGGDDLFCFFFKLFFITA